MCRRFSPILIQLFKPSIKSKGAQKFPSEKQSYKLIYALTSKIQIPLMMLFSICLKSELRGIQEFLYNIIHCVKIDGIPINLIDASRV